MHWTELLTHLLAFALGVGTWLPFTLWEGNRIYKRGDRLMDASPEEPPTKTPTRQPFSRSQTVGMIVLVISLLVVGLGYQQVRFQQRFSDAAKCYTAWGKDVTKALDKRTHANTRQTNADRGRDNAVDGIILTIITFQKAKPPLTQQAQQRTFSKALNAFARAKAKQTRVDAATKKTKKDNPYPKLNC